MYAGEKFRREVEALLVKAKVSKKDINLELPPRGIDADLAFPCFPLAKKLKKNPAEIASEISLNAEPSGLVEKIEASGPYVNFYADWMKLGSLLLKEILTKKERYGSSVGKKKILIEFPSPNTNKPLHLGHLRNIFLAEAVAHTLDFLGNSVIKVNLNNDRGVHICKSMLAYKKWGKGKQPKKKTDHFVGDFYVLFSQKALKQKSLDKEVQEMLKKWEEGDKEIVALWRKMNSWALKGFDDTYRRLGVSFKKTYNESELYEKGKDIVLNAHKKRIFKKNEKGDIIAKLDPLPDKVVLRADGTSIYMTQDIHLAMKYKKDFNPDLSIYVVGSEQILNFKQLFKILDMLSFKGKSHHLSYGMVNLPSGRMKSREGLVVDADDLLDNMEAISGKELKKRGVKIKNLSTVIGFGALKYFLLKVDSNKDITFNPEESLSLEGNTAPYIQYTHARASSILRKAKGMKSSSKIETLTEKEAALLKKLMQFPDVATASGRDYKPHYIATYAYELANLFNEFYQVIPVIKSESRDSRLALVKATKQTIKNALFLLGIESPERM
jgi:arginyl-tRNA synthetase